MNIACTGADVALQILNLLKRRGITRGVRWESGSPIDEQIWVIVYALIDPAVEVAIRRDIGSIAGAAVQE